MNVFCKFYSRKHIFRTTKIAENAMELNEGCAKDDEVMVIKWGVNEKIAGEVVFVSLKRSANK